MSEANEDTALLQNRVSALEKQLHTLMSAYLELNVALDVYLLKTKTDMKAPGTEDRTIREQLDASWQKVFESWNDSNGS